VALLAALVLPLASWASTLLLGTDAHAGLVRISMVGAAFVSLYVVVSGLFSGRSDVGGPMIVAVASGVVSLAVTFMLVPAAGLTGGTIGIAIMMPAGLAAAFWARRHRHRAALLPVPRPPFDPATARALLTVGLAALVPALLELGTTIGLRAHYLRVHGIAANGLLQAGVALAQQGSAMFIAYLMTYAFGRLSGAGDAVRIRDYTRRQWAPLVALAALGFAIAMLWSEPLLALFYSRPFVAARPLMAWALFAEFCRVMTQLWSLGALPMGAVRSWIAIGAAGPPAVAAAYALLAPVAGALSLPYAAAAGALVQLGVAALLMRRQGITPRPGGALLLAVVMAGLAWLARTVAR
jgi:O-antigen/teichoic acid export membrane protein